MDPQYYLRTAMAGWVFLAVIAGSLWSSGDHRWTGLISQFHTSSTGAAAVIGVIIGVGAPPAFGFLLERLSSLAFWCFGQNLWRYSCTKVFRDRLVALLGDHSVSVFPESAGALFHVFFYSCADQRLVDWSRRRRTQAYASATSAFAIVLALVIACVLRAVSLWFDGIACLVLVVLIVHTLRELRVDRETISAWAMTFGSRAISDFLTDEPTGIS